MVQITKLQELDWEISHTHNRHSRPYIRYTLDGVVATRFTSSTN